MVEIEETMDEEPQTQQQPEEPAPSGTNADAADSRSQERMADADEIEAALANITRPSARLHVQNLITKLRKEGAALERVAAMTNKASAMEITPTEDAAAATPAEAAPKAKPTALPQSVPARSPAKPVSHPSSKYQVFPTYFFDAGQYNSPTVSVYVPLENIGQHDKSKISCNFTSSSFDLIVTDFEGKSYRLLNDNLEHDIETDKSKFIVKPNKIIIKLGKVKGEYSYDHWSQLTAKKKKVKSGAKEDPAAGIMDMMKDMYEGGDDNMKKMIGETMYKQRTGQLDPMGGMGGMGGMGDMGDF